jgi:hypothetical protein
MAAQLTYALTLTPGPQLGKLVAISTPDFSAALADKTTDSLYLAVADDAHQLHAGTVRDTGTWARRIVQAKYESYSWLKVLSNFTDADGSAASVTVTIADAAGTTLATNVVTSREPVRVAPFRELEIILTVSSKARVAEVVFASSAEEMKAV